MSLPGVQTEKTMLAERDQQIRYKQQQRAMEEIREAEEVLKHYESYKMGGDSNQELETLLRQKRAELEAKKRALGIEGRPQAAPGAAVAFDMNSKEAAAKPTRDFLFSQGGAQMPSAPVPPSQESERDRRLRLRAEERARKQTGNTTSAYGSAQERPGPTGQQSYAVEVQPFTPVGDQRGFSDPQTQPAFRQIQRTLPEQYDRPAAFDQRQAPSVAYDPMLRQQPSPAYDSMPRQQPSVAYDPMQRQQPSVAYDPIQRQQPSAAYDPIPRQQPSYDPIQRQPSLSEAGVDMSSYASTGAGRSQKPEEPPETGFPFTRQDEDKKEKQRRYREELDRQQAERKPPKPTRTPSSDAGMDTGMYQPPVSQTDPQVDEKREKQRRYKEELDRMAAAKAANSGQMDRGRTLSSGGDTSYLPPAPYQSDRSGQDDPRIREMEKKQRYAQELKEMMDEKARLKQRDSDQYAYQSTPQTDYRAMESEKKAMYARQLEEQIRQRPVQGDERSAYIDTPPDTQNQMPDPALERKLQYKAELQKQMEEQKRRKEEEKQRQKEQALLEDAKFLAEFAEAKRTGKKVSDPNRPSSDHPTAARYEQMVGERKKTEIDPQDRPIGVAEPKARPPRPEAFPPPDPIPVSQPPQRPGLFDPVSDESKPLDLLSQYPPKATSYQPPSPHSFPTPYNDSQSFPTSQRPTIGTQSRQPLGAYMGPPPSSMETVEQYYKEIQEIRVERDRAKKEMLELREMMLKEKENRLEEMIKMISAQAMNRPQGWPQAYTPPPIPGQYPGYAQPTFPTDPQPYSPSAGPQWAAFPPTNPSFPTNPPNPPPQQYTGMAQIGQFPGQQSSIPVTEQFYVSPSMQGRGDDWKANVSPRFAGEALDLLPAEVYTKPVSDAVGSYKPKGTMESSLSAQPFDYMEKSMSGSSHFVDPHSMMWGTTHLLASGNKKPLDGRVMSPEEMEKSLASEVTHVPIPALEQDPPIIEQIEEEPVEREEDFPRASSVRTPIEPFLQTSSGDVDSSMKTPLAPKLSIYPDPLQLSDSNAIVHPRTRHELDPIKLSDSEASKGLRPRSRPKPEEVDICNLKSGNALDSLPDVSSEPSILDPPPRTSSASGRKGPKTLDVFKGHQPMKPGKQGGQGGKKGGEVKPQESRPRPEDPKPSFHRLQDVRDRKKQEKPRDGLDTLQEALEKLNQQRQGASDSVSLDGSSTSQFESRFRVVAMNELKGERPPSSPKPAAVFTPAQKDILDQFVESVQQTNSRPVSKSSARYTEDQGDV